jgi:hypothetical protein
MSNEYDISALTDLLELEPDQVERLCAELPAMIAHVKGLVTLLDAVGDAIGQDTAVQLLSPMRWIDDGKTDIDITLTCEGDEALSYKVTSNE